MSEERDVKSETSFRALGIRLARQILELSIADLKGSLARKPSAFDETDIARTICSALIYGLIVESERLQIDFPDALHLATQLRVEDFKTGAAHELAKPATVN